MERTEQNLPPDLVGSTSTSQAQKRHCGSFGECCLTPVLYSFQNQSGRFPIRSLPRQCQLPVAAASWSGSAGTLPSFWRGKVCALAASCGPFPPPGNENSAATQTPCRVCRWMMLNRASVFIMTSLLLCPWGDLFNLAPIIYLIQGRLNRNKAREHLHINNDHVGAAALPSVTEMTEAPVSLEQAWGRKPQLFASGLVQHGEVGVNHIPHLTGSDGRHWGGP